MGTSSPASFCRAPRRAAKQKRGVISILLVLLQAPFDYFQEIWNLAELLYPLHLESDRLISVKPAEMQEFQAGTLQFYRYARRDGIQL